MKYFEAILKLKIHQVILLSHLFLTLISSGFLLIFLYKENLLVELGVVKLIIFSISFSLPVYTLNSIFMSHDMKENSLFDLAISSSILSFIILYFTIAISYIFSFSFITFISIMVILEILVYFTFVKDLKISTPFKNEK